MHLTSPRLHLLSIALGLHLLGLHLLAPRAAAQDADSVPARQATHETSATVPRGPIWMLLPVGAGPRMPDWIEATSAGINAELMHQVPALDAVSQRALLEQRVSSPPAQLTNLQIDAWMSHSRSAIMHLGSMEYEQARMDLLQTEAVSARAAEELNRENHRAHAVLETCLYLVRVFVETGQFARAEEHARECRMLVPGLEANAFAQTPEVNEVLHHVDEAMRHEPRGHLRVESSPTGCTVRINGLVFGRTPFTMDDMARGDYRLQVECEDDVRGRVHHVRVGDAETVVRVDARFEGVFETRSFPHLRYADAGESRSHRVLDALRLARDGGASHVLLFVPIDVGVRIDRVDTDSQTLVASVRLPVHHEAMPPIASALTVLAVRALLAGRSLDFTTSPPQRMTAWSGPHSRPPLGLVAGQASAVDGDGDAEVSASRRRAFGVGMAPLARRPHGTLGWALAGAGVVALGVSFGLEFHSGGVGDRYARAESFDLDFLSRQSDWKTSRGLTLSIASVGAIASSLGLGLALPPRDRVPAAAWVSGAIGLGLVAGGAIFGLGANSCAHTPEDRNACVSRAKRVDLGVLLALTGAPLFSVPLSYLLMSRSSQLSADVRVGPGYATFALRGVL